MPGRGNEPVDYEAVASELEKAAEVLDQTTQDKARVAHLRKLAADIRAEISTRTRNSGRGS